MKKTLLVSLFACALLCFQLSVAAGSRTLPTKNEFAIDEISKSFTIWQITYTCGSRTYEVCCFGSAEAAVNYVAYNPPQQYCRQAGNNR